MVFKSIFWKILADLTFMKIEDMKNFRFNNILNSWKRSSDVIDLEYGVLKKLKRIWKSYAITKFTFFTRQDVVVFSRNKISVKETLTVWKSFDPNVQYF